MARPTPLQQLLSLSLLWLLSCLSSWLPSLNGQFLLGTFTHPESYTPQRRIPLFPGQLTSVQSKIYRSLHSGAGWRTPNSHFPPAGVLSHRMGIFDEIRNTKKGSLTSHLITFKFKGLLYRTPARQLDSASSIQCAKVLKLLFTDQAFF